MKNAPIVICIGALLLFSFGCCGAYGKLLDEKLGMIPPLPEKINNNGEEMPPPPPDTLPLNSQATEGEAPPPPPPN